MTNRRIFMMTLVAGGSALGTASAVAQAKLDPNSPQAKSLGYVDDTAKADAKKFPKHEASQHCANCQLYSGKAGAADGPCSLFPGKLVASNGWCSAWVKKG